MNQQQKYIASGVALFVILIIGFFIFWRSSMPNTDLQFGVEDGQQEVIIPAAKTLRSSEIATTISDTQSQDSNFLACTSEKLSLCTQIPSDTPWLSVTGSLSEQLSTMKMYAEKGELQDNCIADSLVACSNIAIQQKTEKEPSLAICDEYADAVAKTACINDMYPKLAIFKDDATVCGQSTDMYVQKFCADNYNADKAVKNKDVSWCGRLSSPDRQNECKMSFVTKTAIYSSDIGFCSKSSNPEQMQNCYKSYIMQKMETTSIETCKKIYDYASYVPNKTELDRMHRDCLNRMSNELLQSFRNDSSLIASKSEEYKRVCALFPEMEKKICLDELTRVSPSNTANISSTPPMPVASGSTQSTP